MAILETIGLDTAARALESGELVIVPTDRWYMICCDAANAKACSLIFEGKRRRPDKSLLLVLPSNVLAYSYFDITDDAAALIRNFWPGDLSLLLRWSDATLGSRYSAVGSPVALVNNSSGLIGELSRRAGVLIAATSANVSSPGTTGIGPAISINQVVEFVRESALRVRGVVDGGICAQFNHLTIVDCSTPLAALRREGVVHQRALSAAVGRVIELAK
jgi:L-threonylcarbamoyladenylate synthase